MARGRPTKIESIVGGQLEPGRTYTVREIAKIPEVAATYKDYGAAYSAIRQLLVNKLHLSPAGSRGEGASSAMFFEGDAILAALQVPLPNPEPLLPKQAPHTPDREEPARKPVQGFRLKRLFVVMSASAIAAVILFFILPERTPREKIRALQKAGDIAGLRAFEREMRTMEDLNTGDTLQAERAELHRAFGGELQLTHVPAVKTNRPYRQEIAAAIASLHPEVEHLSIDDLSAVFPKLETWLFNTPKGVIPVQLGARVKIDGAGGHVSRIEPTYCTISTDQGGEVNLSRPELKVMGTGEQPGLKTLIYPHPAGNLDGLLAWAAEQLEVPLIDQADLDGQVAGYFPPYDSVRAFVEDLADPGVRLTGDSLVLLPEPKLKLHLGFFETQIYRGGTWDQHFTELASLLPQGLSWPELPPGNWWYSGQQLDTLIAQLQMDPVFRRDGSVVLIGEEQPE
ncbi:MAG: hypothetical protein QNK37_02440 [Acidobacteriota bacterium]|nr:hypothetical protein [Acidobacteriota bacterium]